MIGLLDSLKVRNGSAAPARIAVGSQLELNDFSRLSSRLSVCSLVKSARKFAPEKAESSSKLPLSESSRKFGIFANAAAGIDEMPDLSNLKTRTS